MTLTTINQLTESRLFRHPQTISNLGDKGIKDLTFLYILVLYIMYNEPEVIQDDFGADLSANIEMFFQRENLSSGSLNFYPEIGDVVDWNDNYWEINGTTEPQLFAGHPNFKHNIVATAHRSRLSSLQIEERPR